MKLSREDRKILNNKTAAFLKKFVEKENLEEKYCYHVKNIDKDNNICFVHKFDGVKKSFENLDLSTLPDNVKADDILVKKDNEYIVHNLATKRLYEMKQLFFDEVANSIELFQIENEEYIVSDKSEDSLSPTMSLKCIDEDKEFVDIEIELELYSKIKYGSVVKYENGKYVLVKE